MVRWMAITAVAAGLVAAGCGPAVLARRPAAPADLVCDLQTIGLQPEGGLPLQVRVTVRNVSPQAVAFTVPRPLAGEASPGPSDDLPLPILSLSLKDAAGREISPVYTHPKARRWPKAQQTVLEPGGSWSAVYALSDFYLWGPCGPDGGGPFIKYFWRGDKEVRLAAVIVLGKDAAVVSKPVTLRCSVEDWLFRK